MERMSASERVTAAPPPSMEEEDAMKRSRKKVRAGEGEFTSEHSMLPRDEEWMHGEDLHEPESVVKGGKWKSFKEAVANTQSVEEDDEEWWKGEGWKERCRVEMTPKGPNVVFLPHEKERLAQKWRNALIVKLLGRMIIPNYLEKKLQQLWAKYGEIETIDVGAGFFVVNFSDVHDYELALTGGPWLIYDHYLSVQPWKQDFNPDA